MKKSLVMMLFCIVLCVSQKIEAVTDYYYINLRVFNDFFGYLDGKWDTRITIYDDEKTVLWTQMFVDQEYKDGYAKLRIRDRTFIVAEATRVGLHIEQIDDEIMIDIATIPFAKYTEYAQYVPFSGIEGVPEPVAFLVKDVTVAEGEGEKGVRIRNDSKNNNTGSSVGVAADADRVVGVFRALKDDRGERVVGLGSETNADVVFWRNGVELLRLSEAGVSLNLADTRVRSEVLDPSLQRLSRLDGSELKQLSESGFDEALKAKWTALVERQAEKADQSAVYSQEEIDEKLTAMTAVQAAQRAQAVQGVLDQVYPKERVYQQSELYTKSESDARFLSRDRVFSLSDIPDMGSQYYSKQEIEDRFALKETTISGSTLEFGGSNASTSGASRVGFFDELYFSDEITVQGAMNDLDQALEQVLKMQEKKANSNEVYSKAESDGRYLPINGRVSIQNVSGLDSMASKLELESGMSEKLGKGERAVDTALFNEKPASYYLNYENLENRPEIAYSQRIAADQFSEQAVAQLLNNKLSDGSSPWSNKLDAEAQARDSDQLDGFQASDFVLQSDPRLSDKRKPGVSGEQNGDLMTFKDGEWVRVPRGNANQVLSVSGSGFVKWVDQTRDTQLTEFEVDSMVENNNYLEVVSNADIRGKIDFDKLEIKKEDVTGLGLPASDTQLSEAEVDAFVGNNGYLKSVSNADISGKIAFSKLEIEKTDLTTLGLPSEDTQLTEAQVDVMVANNGYLPDSDPRLSDKRKPRVSGEQNGDLMMFKDGDWVRVPRGDTNQVLSVSGSGFVKWVDQPRDTQLSEAQVDSMVANNSYLLSVSNADITGKIDFAKLEIEKADLIALGLPASDTHLTEDQVDAFVANDHYLKSVSNADITGKIDFAKLDIEKTDLTALGVPESDTQLTEAQVDVMVANNGYLPDSDPRLSDKRKPRVSGEQNGDLMTFKDGDWVRVPRGNPNQVLSVSTTGFVKWVDQSEDTNTWRSNSVSSEGVVAKGEGQSNKVWKTDATGVPGWREDAGLSDSDIETFGYLKINDLPQYPADSLSSSQVEKLKQGTLSDGSKPWEVKLNAFAKAVDSDKLDNLDSTFFRNASNLNAGTVSNARLDADLQDLADGSLSGSKVGAGINSNHLTQGTIKVYDNGNVGIGTAAAPSEKMEVGGNLLVNGKIKAESIEYTNSESQTFTGDQISNKPKTGIEGEFYTSHQTLILTKTLDISQGGTFLVETGLKSTDYKVYVQWIQISNNNRTKTYPIMPQNEIVKFQWDWVSGPINETTGKPSWPGHPDNSEGWVQDGTIVPNNKWLLIKHDTGTHMIQLDILEAKKYYSSEYFVQGNNNNLKRYSYSPLFANDDFSNAEIAVKLDVVAR